MTGAGPPGTDMRHFPLFGLALTTPRLVLRPPSLESLDELAQRAFEGVHEPDRMPFGRPAWSDAEPADRARGTFTHMLGTLGAWKPDAWACPFIVGRRDDGRVIGTQRLGARSFAVVGTVTSGSWLALAEHGQGFGTEMRAAVLHLAFAGLGARRARSSAFVDNPASLSVSRKLGYVEDGTEEFERDGERAIHQRLLLTREAWERHRTVEVEIDGLEQCLPLFGVTDPDAGRT